MADYAKLYVKKITAKRNIMRQAVIFSFLVENRYQQRLTERAKISK